MAASSFADLFFHIGHKIVCAYYSPTKKKADAHNVALECETCHEVLLDFDKEDEEEVSLSPAMQKFFWAEINNKQSYDTVTPCTLGEAEGSLMQMPTDVLQEIVGKDVTRHAIQQELTALIKAWDRQTFLLSLMPENRR